jgi:hypothetical protein
MARPTLHLWDVEELSRCHLDQLNDLMDNTWRPVRRLGCIMGSGGWEEETWSTGLEWIRNRDDHTDGGEWERKRGTWHGVSG